MIFVIIITIIRITFIEFDKSSIKSRYILSLKTFLRLLSSSNRQNPYNPRNRSSKIPPHILATIFLPRMFRNFLTHRSFPSTRSIPTGLHLYFSSPPFPTFSLFDHSVSLHQLNYLFPRSSSFRTIFQRQPAVRDSHCSSPSSAAQIQSRYSVYESIIIENVALTHPILFGNAWTDLWLIFISIFISIVMACGLWIRWGIVYRPKGSGASHIMWYIRGIVILESKIEIGMQR